MKLDPHDAVAPGLSSWARKTKQTTAVPRDPPARSGGDDGREVDGNNGDGGVREWG